MDGEVVIGTRLDTKSFESQIAKLEDDLDRLEQERETIASQKTIGEGDLELLKEYDAQIEKTTNQIIGLQEKQKDLSSQNTFSGMNFNLDNIIRKVTRWGLALFGVRTAYSMIRRAMSTLSEQDENLASQVQYIQWTLANSIAPIVKFIVNAVYAILQVINSITKALFGKEIFAGPKAFEKSMKGASKSAEKIKKSLAGFDEMNILADNSSSDGGAGGGGVSMPKFDDVIIPELPGWLKEVLLYAGLVAGAFLLITQNASVLLGLGIGVAIGGVLMLISDIVEFIQDPSWKNFINILGDIAVIIGGIMMIMGNWWGLLVVIIGLAVKLIVNNWDTIKGVLEKIWGWVMDYVITPIWDSIKMFVGQIVIIIQAFWGIIKGLFTTAINILILPFQVLWDTVKGVFNGIKQIVQGVFNIIKGLFTGDWKTVMKGFKQIFKGAFDSLVSIAKAPLNLVIGAINSLIKGINKIKIDVPDWVPIIGGGKFSFKIKEIPKLAKGTILNNPGRGVPVAGGNAIAGEAGREAFLPLSDTQLLEELGSTIGRYITINLTNETKLDGRTIARKVSQLSNNDNFLRNR